MVTLILAGGLDPRIHSYTNFAMLGGIVVMIFVCTMVTLLGHYFGVAILLTMYSVCCSSRSTHEDFSSATISVLVGNISCRMANGFRVAVRRRGRLRHF